jgi:hypothetical protein
MSMATATLEPVLLDQLTVDAIRVPSVDAVKKPMELADGLSKSRNLG